MENSELRIENEEYIIIYDFFSFLRPSVFSALNEFEKQTQFLSGQNDVKSIFTMAYGDFDDPDQQKNKANQSQ